MKKGLRTKPNIADFNSKLIEFNTVLKSKARSRPCHCLRDRDSLGSHLVSPTRTKWWFHTHGITLVH